MAAPTTTTTPHCTFTFLEPRLLLQRFTPTARFTPAFVAEMSALRNTLCGNELHAVMVVIPAEVAVDPVSTNVDHFLSERTQRRILALAVVAEGNIMHSVSKFYFGWFPQVFQANVFSEEDRALEWLREKLLHASG